MTTPSVFEPADPAVVRACLIDGLSTAAALQADSRRVRLRHVERALALSKHSPMLPVDALLSMLGHYAGGHAPLPWTRAALRHREDALGEGASTGREFPDAALRLVARMLETSGEAFDWASPDRTGLGAALNRTPEGHREDARMLMLAMVGVTSLDGEPMVTTAHALRIANLLGANSAHARAQLQVDLKARLPRAAARESREQSFAYFLHAGRIRQPNVTRAPLTLGALRVLGVLLGAVADGTLTLPMIDSHGGDRSAVAIPPDTAQVIEPMGVAVSASPLVPVPTVTAQPAFNGLLLGWEGRCVASATTRRAMTPILHRGDGHLITIAPTGAGKGVGALIPALLSHAGSAVVIDPKGENYAVTAAFRRALGQHVFVLDPFGITGATSDRLNPLDLFGADGHVCREDALLLTHLLAMETGSVNRNRFWYDRGSELLATALLFAGNSEAHREQGLAGVLSLFSDSISTLRLLGQMLNRSSNQDLRDAAGILLAGRDDLLHSVLMIAHGMVAPLDDPAVHAVCAGPSTLPLDFLTQDVPVTIYLVLPPDKLVSHAALLRLWVGMLLTAVQRRTVIPARPTLFLLDEAAQLGTLPQLVTAITLMRGYGLQVWTFWQDLAQLRHLYPQEWPTLLHNCAVHQVFGVPHEAAAQQLAQLNGIDDHRTLLDCDGRSLLLARAGRPPEVVRRPNYLSDAPFSGLAAANPMYAHRTTTTNNVTPLPIRRAPPTAICRTGGAL